jgi:hypothetical protein
VLLNLVVLDRNWKTQYSAPNDILHSLPSICSVFLPE